MTNRPYTIEKKNRFVSAMAALPKREVNRPGCMMTFTRLVDLSELQAIRNEAARRDALKPSATAFVVKALALVIRDTDKFTLSELTWQLDLLARADASTNAQWRAFSRLIRWTPGWLSARIMLNWDRRIMAGAQFARFFHRMVEILEHPRREMADFLS